MAAKATLKCAKCGVTSKEDPTLTFHRFPLPSKKVGSIKAKVWATFCFPDESWTSDESLVNLFKQHKMLCGKHFDNSSFTSSDRKKLNRFAIPTDAKAIMARLKGEQHNPSQHSDYAKQGEAEASTSQNIFSVCTEDSNVTNPERPTLTKQKERKSFLKDLDVKTKLELTPKKLKMYKRCRGYLSEIIRLRGKLKAKKADLSSLTYHNPVNKLIQSKLTSQFCLLLQSQLKNVPRKKTGRRWTLDDKVFALSIYKKSSACYRLLRRLICLPSPSSLKKLLNKIPLVCGINQQIQDTIKEITNKRLPDENLCILAFDEMSIRKHIYYNSKLDKIDGYQDHANQGRTAEIATQALTFMAIGLRKPWKQPISFYFSADHVTADRLAVLIKEVLGACFSAGLQVMGTVCDLDGVNIRAINLLGSSRDQPFFNFQGHEIVTILDPPHLLKCFRNNFMKHDIEFTLDLQTEEQQVPGVAKWSHIEKFFEIDNLNSDFVHAPALTKQHLQPNGKQKMKVSLAAQVLSHSVASGIFARCGINELPPEAVGTANVIANMDKLFDAMNGNTPDLKRGKPLLRNMSSSTPHLEFFAKMKRFFAKMKFIGARSRPPSQDGWLRTLNAIERIFRNLKQRNIDSISLRRLNQDPLENCFGCIRSNCGCNPNPTSGQFIAGLKTSIITNLINTNGKNRNCLDDSYNLLSNFKQFLCKDGGESSVTTDDSMEHLEEISHTVTGVNFDIPQCSAEMQACAYVCGFIAKKMCINCQHCKKIMLAEQNTEVCHIFTSFKEYSDVRSSLKYVQRSFIIMVENAAKLINKYLKDHCHKEKIKYNLMKICNDNLNKEWLKGCGKHYTENFKKIVDSTIAICVKRFCILKNREFVEEAAKKSLNRKLNILQNV